MITDWAAVVWKKLPWKVRRLAVRATQPTFTVSVAALVFGPSNKILLLDHLIRPGTGWGIPGGFLEIGEQADEGIRREIREEIGLELDALRLIRIRAAGSHIEILFTAIAIGEAEIKSREIKDFGWFGPDSLPPKINEAQKALIITALEGGFEKCPAAD